jgi:hypothetical protein
VVGNQHVRALTCKGQSHSTPDAGVGASDERGFAFQFAAALIRAFAVVRLYNHLGFAPGARQQRLLNALVLRRAGPFLLWVLFLSIHVSS